MKSFLNTETESLLVKHFDHALTELERQELNEFLNASPELANEVRGMEEFDDFLDGAGLDDYDFDDNDAVFLNSMRGRFAQAAAEHAVRGAGAAFSPVVPQTGANLASALWSSWAGKSAFFIVAAGGLAFAVWQWYPRSAPSDATSAARQETARQAPAASQTGDNATAPRPHPSAERKATERPANATAQESVAAVENSASAADTAKSRTQAEASDAKARASIQSAAPAQEKLWKLIEQRRQDLAEKEKSGDKVGAAFAEKTLGVLYRESGNFSESAAAFARALKAAQALKLRELEGDALGETALLKKAEHNAEQAAQLLRQCVDILNSAGAKSAERWAKELRRLENSSK